MVMERIDLEKAKVIAKNKGLKPGKVKGTTGIQFTKGKNNRLDVIEWAEFESILKERKITDETSAALKEVLTAFQKQFVVTEG